MLWYGQLLPNLWDWAAVQRGSTDLRLGCQRQVPYCTSAKSIPKGQPQPFSKTEESKPFTQSQPKPFTKSQPKPLATPST